MKLQFPICFTLNSERSLGFELLFSALVSKHKMYFFFSVTTVLPSPSPSLTSAQPLPLVPVHLPLLAYSHAHTLTKNQHKNTAFSHTPLVSGAREHTFPRNEYYGFNNSSTKMGLGEVPKSLVEPRTPAIQGQCITMIIIL